MHAKKILLILLKLRYGQFRFAILISTLLLTFSVSGQRAGDIDTTFNPTDIGYGFGDGPNGTVYGIIIQPDNKIIINGNFSFYNGSYRNRIARLNDDGSLDETFNPGIGSNDVITGFRLQSNGKILIAGEFTSYNNIESNYIARLNSDGTLDDTFDSGLELNSKVNSIAVQPDDKILVAGQFRKYNGENFPGFARLHSDGTVDKSFNPEIAYNASLSKVILQPNGQILIYGYIGKSMKSIVRLNSNGSLDKNFDSELKFNTTYNVSVMTQQHDGKILINGVYYVDDGNPIDFFKRLNYNGSLDYTFKVDTNLNYAANVIAVLPDDKFLMGGFIGYKGDIYKNGLIRFNKDGSFDDSFAPECNRSYIYTIGLQTDGKKILGGSFNYCHDQYIHNLARIFDDGTIDETFVIQPGTGANENVESSIIQPDGKILIGGSFDYYNGVQRKKIARVNFDGSLDDTFNPGYGANSYINALALQIDGKVLVGGDFTSFNDRFHNKIVRLNSNGTIDDSFNTGLGFNNQVLTFAIQSDGKIIVGGKFNQFNGSTRNGLVRLNNNGSLDSSFISFGTNRGGEVERIVIQPDGKIIVGGFFSSFNGINRSGLVRLNNDGSLDDTFKTGSGAYNVTGIAVQPDGKILISGPFYRFNGGSNHFVERLHDDGSADKSFNFVNGSNNFVDKLLLQPNGRIIIVGYDFRIDGNLRHSIARLNSDGSLDKTFNSGSGTNSTISTISMQPDGNLIIGGYFISFNGTGRNRLARIFGNGDYCGFSSVLSIVGTTDTTATIKWDDDEGDYQYIVNDYNIVPGEMETFIHANEILLTDLTPETTYFFYIRKKCGDNFFSDWEKISFTTQKRTSTEDITPKVIIYPNPVINDLWIEGLTYPEVFNVYDVNGRLVSQTLLTSPSESIDFYRLPSGIYFLKNVRGNIFNRIAKF